jgi:hypothetical protein
MDLLGHTLSTPDLTLREALALFSELGLDGAEVIAPGRAVLPGHTDVRSETAGSQARGGLRDARASGGARAGRPGGGRAAAGCMSALRRGG